MQQSSQDCHDRLCSGQNEETIEHHDLESVSCKLECELVDAGVASANTSCNYNHQCYICDKTFSANSNLNRHLRKIHKENVQSPYNNVKCALCESLYSSSSMYISHLEDDHKVNIVTERLTFQTKQLFEDWKHSVENETTSQFIKSRGEKRTKNVNKTYYSCNRSGYYVSKARTQKALKKQGSRKINGRCPASINVTIQQDSSYDVRFIKTHVGHDFELKHLDLSEKDRDLIVKKLVSGITKRDIIRQIRSTVDGAACSVSPASNITSGLGCATYSGLNSADTTKSVQQIVINSRSSVPGCSEQQIEVVVPAATSEITIVSSSTPVTRSLTQTESCSPTKQEHQQQQHDQEQQQEQQQPSTTVTAETTEPFPKSRLHLATTKDIHNILNSKHLDSKKIRHNYDLNTIEAWISEMNDYNDDNPTVLLYKDQTELIERYPKLRHDDFMLVLMKQGQADILKQLGPRCVMIDSTHNVHCEYLHVTYLAVIDEEHRGFPVAYMFSTRTDLDILEVFFTLLKDRVGIISTRMLIADDLHDFYQAWWKVMSMPAHNLLTPWSVFDNCAKKFKLIKNRDKLRKIKKLLRLLLTETEMDKFSSCLKQIVCDYKKDPDTCKFVDSFDEQYSKNPDLWSNCMRKNYGISNYQLWTMHDKFKTIYKEGKSSKKMCTYITCLMNLFEDYQLDRLIKVEEADQAGKRTIMLGRHKKGIETGSHIYEVAVEPAYWLCPSECHSSDVCDEVRKTEDDKKIKTDTKKTTTTTTTKSEISTSPKSVAGSENKCCDLICAECQTCRHEYRCTCLDYVVNMNMCKHIHRISSLCKQSCGSLLEINPVPD